MVKQLSLVKDSSSFWKIINKCRRKSFPVDQINLHVWEEQLIRMFPSPDNLILNSTLANSSEILDQPISINELILSLKNCKNEKAAGPDKISYEFLKNLPQVAIDCLLHTYNRLLIEEHNLPINWSKISLRMLYKKGNINDPKKFRPIALINSVLKTFTSILNNRLNKFAKLYNLLPEAQAGFREGRSCLDNIFILSSIVQIKLRQEKRKLFALFVDFKEAFPSVHHDLLGHKLNKLGLSNRFLNILKKIYSQAEINIENVNGETPYVKVTKGLLQGEITSPLLFSFYC